MEFLRLFLRRYFAGKTAVASQTVGCFLKLRFSHFPQKPIFTDSNTDRDGNATRTPKETIDLFSLYVLFFFPNSDHVMFYGEFAFCLFHKSYIHEHVDARGLQWENNTYKLKRSIS